MPFFRALTETSPDYNQDLPWPLHGLGYVIAWACPFCGALLAGVMTYRWTGLLIGGVIGTAISLAHFWIGDHVIDPAVAKFQARLNHTTLRIFVNLLFVSWGIGLSALAMFATWLIAAIV